MTPRESYCYRIDKAIISCAVSAYVFCDVCKFLTNKPRTCHSTYEAYCLA
ncbi:hypothetical protein HMPREF0091_10977 [Fannyhessea vaginae DSM 15829]|uniref:Uncharacterized protein n=1 Tax=Fannyhessea vaginae DSM 15829 TaxID=525256 RepID=F1T677_9ACTN|nr:hypothetical protein HMPREF0091_10977 [Fannyhessea vaginae DSM 15829]